MPSDSSQAEAPEEAGLPSELAELALLNHGVNGTVLEESQSENSSVPVARQTELPALTSGNLDAAKKTHADEM